MIALSRSSSVWPRFLATLALIGLLGCGGSTETSPPPPPPPAPPTVTGVTPVLGHGGDAGLQVTVYGTNFSSTTTVAWERNGAAEAKVQVASVQVTNSGTLVAALNIAADAPVSFYDISATNASGKGAPLVERFEVTEGYPIEGTYYAYGVNEAGTVVGQLRGSSHLGFVWTRSGSRADLPTEPGNIDTNGGRAIDEAGATIAGVSGNNAVVWTNAGTGWVAASLPKDPAAGDPVAFAVGSDPVTGKARVIAGADGYGMDGVTPNPTPELNQQPRAWVATGAGWQRVVLPTPTGEVHGTALAASASGRVVGYVSNIGAAVWTPDGLGGWTIKVLNGSRATGINSAGDLVVGNSGTAPAYWKLIGNNWSAPTLLPSTPNCSAAVGVDDSGRILGNPCRPDGRPWLPVVWLSPYDANSIRVFGGLADKTLGGHPRAISIRGTWIAGAGTWLTGFDEAAAYWRAF